mmetsp:Transcript_47625/g.101956  ORF Transcript_47625/g.101956 Transcript_47625/m.101956 type:complete len:685 (-) Transcript_47625:65-2119(-)
MQNGRESPTGRRGKTCGNPLRSKWFGRCLVYVTLAMIIPDLWHAWDIRRVGKAWYFVRKGPIFEASDGDQRAKTNLGDKGSDTDLEAQPGAISNSGHKTNFIKKDKAMESGKSPTGHFPPKSIISNGKLGPVKETVKVNGKFAQSSTTAGAPADHVSSEAAEETSDKKPNAIAVQKPEKGEEKPEEDVEEEAEETVEEKLEQNAAEKPGEKVESKPEENAGETPEENVEEKLQKKPKNMPAKKPQTNNTQPDKKKPGPKNNTKPDKKTANQNNTKHENKKKEDPNRPKATFLTYAANVSAGPEPRYDPANANVLLWSGDDDLVDSATTLVQVLPREKKRNGAFVRGTPTAPGCAQECNTFPGCLRLNQGIGRLGNILSELHHAWYMLNASTFAKGIFISSRYMAYVFDFPEYVCLKDLSRFHPANGSNVTQTLAPECKKSKPVYDPICGEVEPARHMSVAQEYIVPYFSQEMRGCLNRKRPIDEDKIVTIHFRGEDVFGKLVKTSDYVSQSVHDPIYWRMWRQPPCAFYEMLISESDWENVLLITTQDLTNPCVRYLDAKRSTLRNRNGQLLKWELQTGNIVSDVCAILRAKHLVVSSSSMTHNLALLGSTLMEKHVYTLNWGSWRKEWLLRCHTPNMTLHKWENTGIKKGGPRWPNSSKVKSSFQPIIDWLLVSRSFSNYTVC